METLYLSERGCNYTYLIMRLGGYTCRKEFGALSLCESAWYDTRGKEDRTLCIWEIDSNVVCRKRVGSLHMWERCCKFTCGNVTSVRMRLEC